MPGSHNLISVPITRFYSVMASFVPASTFTRFVTNPQADDYVLAEQITSLHATSGNAVEATANGFVLDAETISGTAAAGGTQGIVLLNAQNESFQVMIPMPANAIDTGVAADWSIFLDGDATAADEDLSIKIWDHEGNVILTVEALSFLTTSNRMQVQSTVFGDHANLSRAKHLVVEVDHAGSGTDAVELYQIILRYPTGFENLA